jgi:hypothetical protein
MFGIEYIILEDGRKDVDIMTRVPAFKYPVMQHVSVKISPSAEPFRVP